MGLRRARRGNAPNTMMGMFGLAAFSAIAVDLSLERVSRAQLQVSAEAAALAGAGHLDGTLEGLDRARAAAAEFSRFNRVYGGVPVQDEDIAIGTYDEDGLFVPYDGHITAKEAKKLYGLELRKRESRVGLFMAPLAFGTKSLKRKAKSRAFRPPGGPAGAVQCYLPLAVPDCNFPENPTVNPPPFPITFGNNLTDNAGWAHSQIANTTTVRNVFEGFCEQDEIAIGDRLNVQNGVTATLNKYVADILNENLHWPLPSAWPYEQFPAGPPDRVAPQAFSKTESLVKDTHWGNVIAGPIPLVDMGGTPGSCAGTSTFNGNYEITGFTWGYIYDARAGNSSERGFMLQLDFVTPHEYGTRKDEDARGNIVTPREPPVLASE